LEQELSLLIVFAAGLLSFLSPCVLPLIPGYIAFVSGLSIDQMAESGWTDNKFGFMLSTIQVDLPAEKLGSFKAPLLGVAFAFGWTPCVGPILGAILTYATTMDTVGKGVMLLFVYSAGLGIPFLLTTVAMKGFFKLFSKIKKHMNLIQKISGAILVLLGILMITGNLTLITAKLGFLNGLVW